MTGWITGLDSEGAYLDLSGDGHMRRPLEPGWVIEGRGTGSVAFMAAAGWELTEDGSGSFYAFTARDPDAEPPGVWRYSVHDVRVTALEETRTIKTRVLGEPRRCESCGQVVRTPTSQPVRG